MVRVFIGGLHGVSNYETVLYYRCSIACFLAFLLLSVLKQNQNKACRDNGEKEQQYPRRKAPYLKMLFQLYENFFLFHNNSPVL